MKIKIFIQDNCPNCPSAKKSAKRLKKDGFNVEVYNISTVDGLTESLLHDVLSVPSIVVVNDNDTEIKSWRVGLPTIDELTREIK